MKFKMRCTGVRSDRPRSVPVMNNARGEGGGSYAMLEGTVLTRPCRTDPASIAVRVPDEVAREMFGGTVTVTLEVEG